MKGHEVLEEKKCLRNKIKPGSLAAKNWEKDQKMRQFELERSI